MIIYFDLDDTLFGESDFCRSAYAEVAFTLQQAHGRDFSYIVDKMYELLLRRENPFSWLEEELRVLGLWREGVIGELVEIYRTHAPAVLPLPEGSRRLLDALKKRGVRMGIISDGRSLTQRNKMKALGIESYFAPEDIFISEECGADKRSDVMFRKAMEQHPDEAMIYVGDNTAKDFRQPNLLGWTTFCLRHMRPMVHPQDFNSSWPDAPARILSHLPELLLLLPR